MRKRTLRVLLYVTVVVLCSFLSLLIQSSDLGVWVEQRGYDLRFKLRGPLHRLEEPGVVIVAIDDESLDRIADPLMLWQKYFARVVTGLVSAPAAVVGIDFLFSDISEIDPAGQQEFLQALLRSGLSDVPVILGYRVRRESVDQPPALLVAAAGDHFAFINLTTDNDDFVRRQRLYSEDEGGLPAPGFAWLLATRYLESRGENPALPARTPQTVLINFRGLDSFSRVPFWRVLAAAEQGDRDFLSSNFKNRIVLIGVTGDEDLHSTPLYYWGGREQRQNLRTQGVEIHAHTIATLFEQNYPLPLSEPLQFGLNVALVALVAFLCFWLSPALGLLLSLGVLVLFLLVASVWAFQAHWWIQVTAPVVACAVAAGACETLNYILEGREKRHLHRLFQRYVSEEVVKQILETPERLVLTGQRRTVTILFSDIRNFTTRSEGIPAETLVADLNQYFTAMVEQIQSHRGLVDKFIGDGIMAVFGAPLDDPDSADHAVQAARAMMKSLESINRSFAERGAEPVNIGVGIHAGEAIVGNIGSPRKMEYTAIGDAVNTASRIEALNKKYQSSILISGDTYRALKNPPAVEFLGQELMKGKTRPVEIYKVLP